MDDHQQAGVVLEDVFLVVHDEAEPAWQIDVMLLADGETSVLFVLCMYILAVNLRLSGSWVLDLCSI